METPRATKQIFEKMYQRELSDPEIADMQFNLYGFFKTLYEIDQRIKRQEVCNEPNSRELQRISMTQKLKSGRKSKLIF